MTTPATDAVLARLAGLADRLIELDLERMPALLERLGAPHRRLPPVVQIVGTNGKGSVGAFLRQILTAAGLRVQAYTSPYLVRPTEQVTLRAGEIADAAYAEALARVEDANDGGPLTLFEAMTAAAFVAFAEDPADILLLEAGMGGRRDATNVVERPVATVVTLIALDHTAWLGDTIAAIAAEKAGVIRPGVPVVARPGEPQAEEVVAARCRALGAPLHLAGRDWSVDPASRSYRGQRSLVLPPPALAGPHQLWNAAQALAVIEVLAGFAVDDAAVVRGVESAVWPARLQRLDHGETEVWVDGGHNAHAAAALAEALQAMPAKPLVLILGMMGGRPVASFLEAFRPFAPLVVAVPIGHQPVYTPGAPLAPDAIVAAASGLGLEAVAAASLDEAFFLAATKKPAARILVTGSLYLAGDMLRRAD